MNVVRPILFAGPLVLAILDGRKRETRRPQGNASRQLKLVPPAEQGDYFWVRETFARLGERLVYRADEPNVRVKWTPSIHMPGSACRVVLRVTSARADRLQRMTEADAIAEGFAAVPPFGSALDHFRFAWDVCYGRKGFRWTDDPLVWIYEFDVEMRRADALREFRKLQALRGTRRKAPC